MTLGVGPRLRECKIFSSFAQATPVQTSSTVSVLVPTVGRTRVADAICIPKILLNSRARWVKQTSKATPRFHSLPGPMVVIFNSFHVAKTAAQLVIACVTVSDENCVDMLGSLAGVRGCGRGGESFFHQNRWSDWSGDGELHFAKYR